MKKIIMSIMVAAMCTVLCSCGEAKQSLSSQNTILAIEMQMDVGIACFELHNSNGAVIESIKAKSIEESIINFNKALELVSDAKIKVNNVISSPNFISTGLEELEVNYKETIYLLQKISELSEEEQNKFISLVEDGTNKHIFLAKSLYAFVCLYKIREFDQLPDDEAQTKLKDSWWQFGFDADIECPETINKQELYLIWGMQFLGEFDEDEFLEELQELRENENLSSKEQNRKWAEFIENFISATQRSCVV